MSSAAIGMYRLYCINCFINMTDRIQVSLWPLYPQCYRAGRAWGIKPHKCLIAFHSRLEIGVQLFGSVVIA